MRCHVTAASKPADVYVPLPKDFTRRRVAARDAEEALGLHREG